MAKIQRAVITAKWSELEDIGIQGPDKEQGDCSKFAEHYDDEHFLYIPNKFIEIV